MLMKAPEVRIEQKRKQTKAELNVTLEASKSLTSREEATKQAVVRQVG